MPILSFADSDTKALFIQDTRPRKKGWSPICKIARRKLDMIHYAKDLKDLRSPPNNCLEALKGDLIGWHSIRINDQWRILFKWDKGAHDVQIVDYH